MTPLPLKSAGAWLRARANLALRVLGDALCFGAAFAAAFYIRFDGHVPTPMWEICLRTLPWVVALKLLVYRYAGLYRSFWRYSGMNELMRLVVTQGAGLGTSLLVVTMSGAATDGFPRGVYLIDAFLSLLLTGGLRFSPRWLREAAPSIWLRRPLRRTAPRIQESAVNAKRLLIVGAGDAGEMVVRELAKNPRSGVAAVGFVDDDPRKLGREIHGVRVLGTCREIVRLSEKHRVEEIVLAMPSVAGPEIRAIVQSCRGVKARLRIVPSLSELGSGAARITDIRDVRLEDLLQREEVKLNLNQISDYLRNKRILVTGAGGSIGSEICRQVARFEPKEIVLFGRGEHSIFWIAQELAVRFPSIVRREVIGDVINKRKLEGVYSAYRPEIVFHAGADKHVPLMELNPDEAVLNNILGTRNVLEVSEAFGVEKLVCISTDKVVNPTSIMGCCKRVAELVVQSRAWKTPSMVVRFGNVLGSRGSVVPTFYEQIRRGGPVTITHPDMTRFFMTIPEAAKLVIQAGALGRGGEIFVLDMGEQVKIADLARDMIQLSANGTASNVQVEVVGIRPGEKLSEELADHTEELQATDHPKVNRIACKGAIPIGLDLRLKELFEAALAMDYDRIRAVLTETIPTYDHSGKPMTTTEQAEVLVGRSSRGFSPASGSMAILDPLITNGAKKNGHANGGGAGNGQRGHLGVERQRKTLTRTSAETDTPQGIAKQAGRAPTLRAGRRRKRRRSVPSLD